MSSVFPCLAAPRVRRALSSGLTALLIAGLTQTARAQILFYDADATINADISGYDVIFGSVNPNSFTVNIDSGAVLTYNYDFSDGYFGPAAYNQSVINIHEGYVSGLALHDSATVNISNGLVYGVSADQNSVANISGGYVSSLSSLANSVVTIGGAAQVVQFNAAGNSAVTISGGEVDYSFLGGNSVTTVSDGQFQNIGAHENSVLNFGGGYTNSLSAGDNATINFSGGTLNNRLYAFYGGTLNVSGGFVASGITAYGNFSGSPQSHVTVSGGTVGSIDAYYGGTVSVSGGTVGAITAYNGPAVILSGGSLTGPIIAYGRSSVEAIGSGLGFSNVIYSGYWDGAHNYANAIYSLTGTLASGDAATATIYAAANYSGDASDLKFQGLYSSLAPNLYQTTDGTVNALYDQVVIGRDATGTMNASPTVSFETGADVGNVDIYNSSVVTVNDGIIHGVLTAHDASDVTINNVNGSYLRAYDNSAVTVNGGTFFGATAEGPSVLTVNGGNIQEVRAQYGGVANVNYGTFNFVGALTGGAVNVSGGLVGIGGVYAQGGVATISGGLVNNAGAQNGTLNVTGGIVAGPISSYYGSVVNISGGSISGPISDYDTSVVNISGSGLSTAGSLLYGSWDGSHNYANGRFNVNGTLTNGDIINTQVYAAANYAGDANALTFYGLNTQEAPDLYVTSFNDVDTVYDHVVVGADETGNATPNAFGFFHAGADTGNVDVVNASGIFSDGGVIRGALNVRDTSGAFLGGGRVDGTITLYDNAVFYAFSNESLYRLVAQDNSAAYLYETNTGYARVQDNATLAIANGYVDQLAVYGGVANISGGFISYADIGPGAVNVTGGSVQVLAANSPDAKITISGDAQVNTLYSGYYGADNLVITMNGGTVNYASLFSGTLDINGGTVSNAATNFGGKVNLKDGVLGYASAYGGQINVSGGEVTGNLYSAYGGIINVSGGDVSGDLVASYYGQGNISGGKVKNVQITSFGAVVTITGGQIGGIDPDLNDADFTGIYVTSGGILNLTGSHIALFNPMPGYFGYYDYGTYYILKGKLLDGSVLNTTFFLGNGGVINITDVPEPGAVAFALVVGIGLLGLLTKGRRRAAVN